jgi:2-polyprenyl-3-methyl-5-hydroxy-6-metoxy-1,4-benzoquinol methylase
MADDGYEFRQHSMSGSYDTLSDEEMAAWDPEGDRGRQVLLNPTIFRMLGDIRGQEVLDAGCGQGYLSRLLADRGATVVGVDPTQRLIDYARDREAERNQGVRYYEGDLSRLDEISGPFDAVVANMVLLNIADWQSAMTNCVSVLRPGGRFIYSLLHPCWAPEAMTSWAARGCVEMREYLREYTVTGAHGVNFHRPLGAYLNETIRLGCPIVEVAEPGATTSDSPAEEEILAHIPNYVVVAAMRTRESVGE